MTAIHTRVSTEYLPTWRILTVAGCVTVAQLRTGHSPLLDILHSPAYLHRIGRRDTATCPYCNGADETAEHLVLHCPALDQTRQSWPNLHYQSDPRHLWSFLERIGVVTRPPDRE